MDRLRPARIAVVSLLVAAPVFAADDTIPFDSDRWVLEGGKIVDHLGRPALTGSGYLRDADFADGVIEFDVAMDGRRSYPGVIFRAGAEGTHERFYLRPHRAGLYPDALQYTPVFSGVACWQLFSGDGYTAASDLPAHRWFHVRMEIAGTQARVFLDSREEPALVIPRLVHGRSRGTLGLMGPADGSAFFSEFRYQTEVDLSFDAPAPQSEPPAGTVTEWEISESFPTDRINQDTYPPVDLIIATEWESVTARPNGLVNVSRYRKRRGPSADCVLARTAIVSDTRQSVRFSFGYSDDATLFFNGRPVFSGRSGYRSRDPSFVGVIGLFDTVHMQLEPGRNEILMMVSEAFGGWGLMGRWNIELDAPRDRHECCEIAWETESVFLTPESVVYDSTRDLLYVTSFDRQFRMKKEPSGFVSKLTTDGEIVELKWVTGLLGPCGMALYDGRLFVAERGRLTEIDVDTGAIIRRHDVPGSRFLNDVAADAAGNVYVSDSYPTTLETCSVIYRLADGEIDPWLEDPSMSRVNGLWVDGDRLLVGNSEGSSLRSVDLNSRKIETIACLGAGIVDGIRPDGEGNYLVSHWEGKTYRISSDAEVEELLDLSPDGLNNADFEYLAEKRLLIIPTFTGNRIVAYSLSGS